MGLLVNIMRSSSPNVLLQAPHPDAVNASMEFLQNLGALDNAENITGLGTVLANLPVDAVIGKMLLMATVCLLYQWKMGMMKLTTLS